MAIIEENNGDAGIGPETQYTMSVGDTFKGRLEAYDEDWVRIELTAGTIYHIPTSHVSASVGLFDAQGNYIVHGVSSLSFTAPVSGTYYIKISDHAVQTQHDYEIPFFENTLPIGTYDEIADHLTGPYAFSVGPEGMLTANVTALTDEGQRLARWALEAWTNVTGIEFRLVDDDNADITFDDSSGYSFATSIVEDGVIVSSHVNVPADRLSRSETGFDWAYWASFRDYMREIGEALGLNSMVRPINPADRLFLNDTFQISVMSNFQQNFDSTFLYVSQAEPVTPMIVDIIAIQNLYGRPSDIHVGDTVYGYQSNVGGYLDEFFMLWTDLVRIPFYQLPLSFTLTLYDNGGIDTLDLRTDTSPQRVDLRPEGISDVYGLIGNLVIARDTIIENYIAGFRSDHIIGNAAANWLQGREGEDKLWGSEGDDALDGGADADRLEGGAGSDMFIFAPGHGNDVIVDFNPGVDKIYLVDFTRINSVNDLTIALDVSGLIIDLSAHGGGTVTLEGFSGMLTEADLSPREIKGTADSDELAGGPGNEILIGSAGADRLDGGEGTDTVSYHESAAGVTVTLRDGSGQNSHAQGDVLVGIENLTGSDYDDVLGGDKTSNRLEGGAGSDELWGGGGDDVLEGGAGTDRLIASVGDDLLAGGADNDLLEGGVGADVFAFAVGHGDDTIIDFELGTDRIDLKDFRDISTIDDLSITRSEADTIIDLSAHGGGTITLEGFSGVLTKVDFYLFDAGAGNDAPTGEPIYEVLIGGLIGLGTSPSAERLEGSPGKNLVVYFSDEAVRVNLKDGTGRGGYAEGDTLVNIEHVIGSDYNDVLIGSDGHNMLIGSAGADLLDGGAGEDVVAYTFSKEAVTVDLQDGTARGGYAEGDTLVNIEHVIGSFHSDDLTGNDGDNLLEGGPGADRLDGGAGEDVAVYWGSQQAVTVNLKDGTGKGGDAEGDTLVGIEGIFGSSHDDTLTGNDGANWLDGEIGDDILEGGPGFDVFHFNPGHGNDVILDFTDNQDRIDLTQFGLSGFHKLTLLPDSDSVTIDLRASDGGTILLEGFDMANLDATDFYFWDNDGGNGDTDEGSGDAPRTVIEGTSGNDRLTGGPGHQVLTGSPGPDRLDGGPDTDTVTYYESDTGVSVLLRDGSGQNGHAEGDILVDIENIVGSDYDDVLGGDNGANHMVGGDGNDGLWGSGGDDILEGRAGIDRLYASSGDDYLDGGSGKDRLEGGAGADRLRGGDDADRFIFTAEHGNDVILDFADNQDRIDLSSFELSGFDQLKVSSDAEGVTIDLTASGGGTILLEGFDINNLDATDFLF